MKHRRAAIGVIGGTLLGLTAAAQGQVGDAGWSDYQEQPISAERVAVNLSGPHPINIPSFTTLRSHAGNRGAPEIISIVPDYENPFSARSKIQILPELPFSTSRSWQGYYGSVQGIGHQPQGNPHTTSQQLHPVATASPLVPLSNYASNMFDAVTTAGTFSGGMIAFKRRRRKMLVNQRRMFRGIF